MDLKKFLNPGSVAVIGASSNKQKLGGQILDNLKTGGFKGKIYPVNPKYKKIKDLKAYSSVLDIKENVDLAIVVIPAPLVFSVVKECAQNNIKNIVIISANFSEAGKEGKSREEELKKIAQENKLNILGPNCLGFINSSLNLNATFADFSFSPSKNPGLAFISQSGAMGSALFDWAGKQRINLKYFLSLGNKAVLDENDFFTYLEKDSQVSVVAAYLENIKEGKVFMRAVSRLSLKKPVIILKTGRSQAGRSAALSHTGSLAGSQEGVEAGLRRSGAVVANNLEDFFSLLRFFSFSAQKKVLSNFGLSIVSNAGGPLVATTDEADKEGIRFPNFSPATLEKLKKEMPALTSFRNPLDILGDASPQRYGKALKLAAQDKNISHILVLLTPQSGTEVMSSAKAVAQVARQNPRKIFLTCFLGDKSVSEAKEFLTKQDSLIDFDYPGQAIRALSHFQDYSKKSSKLKPYSFSVKVEIDKKEGKSRDYLKALQLLKKYNIPVVKTEKVGSKKDLAGLKYPIVLKQVGPDIIHKTDKKGIILNLENKKEAVQAWADLQKKFKTGYCVAQSMTRGEEIILGFRRDPSFGPLIIVGMGGIYTETLKDIELEVDDLSQDRAREMIKKLKVYPILKGARGKKAKDLEFLSQILVNLACLARENPGIKELDINPFFLKEKGGQAGDVRIIS